MSFIIPPPFQIEFPEQLALSDSITGTRSGVAASEKAIGRVNQKIPQARFSHNLTTAYGWIYYGRIDPNTGGMLHFNLEGNKKWAILTLEIRNLDRSRVLDGRDFNFFSLGLMSLSSSQMQEQNQSEITRLLMDSNVTELHAFDTNNINEQYMTLVVSPSKNRLTFFDCPDGMTVRILQEMVIQ
ncbi:hypothetical protein VCHA56P521_310013 [Vibrio chagasii]|nr:hypothetical protein VCHA36P168_280013 [Vibrio chagasii]CAH7188935.1 hypothetical protein VCHA52P461_240045 [Vibrio chagasii]CAH7194840.1 hypothetical protein VCHA37P193_350019 [Vibrio chagasii]CAH7399203.1 hypothetical protein VCHA37P203_320005 [Vibrio chagasii]CAH7410757.1 hypothetical protein VCHA56P521_310013 [Vibrio chagasii]